MDDEDVKEPLVHFKPTDGVLGLCFSFWGKVLVAVVSGVSVAGLVGVVTMISTSIAKIEGVDRRIADVNHNVERQGDQIKAIWSMTADIKTTVETNRIEAKNERESIRDQARANAVAIGNLEGRQR